MHAVLGVLGDTAGLPQFPRGRDVDMGAMQAALVLLVAAAALASPAHARAMATPPPAAAGGDDLNRRHDHPHTAFRSSAAGGSGWSPLAGLPALPKPHHSYRVSNFSAADPLHDDMVRITGGCPLSILDDNYWGEDMIVQCVTAAARHKATLSINHSPWFVHYKTGNKMLDKTLAPDCCPEREAAEMSFYRERLAQTAAWIDSANKRLGSNVTVGAVLLDAERWMASRTNTTWNLALTRKHTLMFNATAELLPNSTLQWYDRGGLMYDGVGTGYYAGSPYYVLDEPGAMFSTSLYTVGELGYTRGQYARTVELAANHSTTVVTPWIALGCGNKQNFHTQGFTFDWSASLTATLCLRLSFAATADGHPSLACFSRRRLPAAQLVDGRPRCQRPGTVSRAHSRLRGWFCACARGGAVPGGDLARRPRAR